MKNKNKKQSGPVFSLAELWPWLFERYQLIGLLWIGVWCVGAAVYSLFVQEYSDAALYSVGVVAIAMAVEFF
jgi:hypothetical protein